MIENEWFYESHDVNGDKIHKEGTYDDEHMHVHNMEDFIDLIRDESNEEEIFDENPNVF